MATWIKFTDGQGTHGLVDLDKAACFLHTTKPDKSKQVQIVVPGAVYVWVNEKSSPEAYKKVLEYMRQIEHQIK